ncbi:MAG: DUF1583 domain-containing protein [Pirellulaceae bacterium]
MNERFSQDFKTQFNPRSLELMGGDSPSRYCRLRPGALQCTIPAGSTDVSFCGISVKLLIKGDFEITGSYTIRELAKPSGGNGAGVKISIKDHRQEWASLQRLCQSNGSQIYSAHRAVMEGGSYKHSSELSPTKAMTGRLRLRRSGSTLDYLVADGPSDEFRQLREVAFTDGDLVQVYFAAQTGGSPTAVDVAWTGITLQAEALVPTYEAPSGPPLWPVFILILVLFAGVTATIAWRIRHRVRG